MNKLKWRPLAALVVVGLLIAVGASHGAANNPQVHVLFAGGALDSTEHPSKWIPIRGMNRIVIRTWSTHAAYTGTGSGDVDSTTSDSIATFKIAFSDSVSFMAVDSLGTVVTARSTTPRTIGVHGEPYPICADSVVFTAVAGGNIDSISTYTLLDNPPINKALRGAANGSGLVSQVWTIPPSSIGPCGDCGFTKDYMRILITPVRRNTSGTSQNGAAAGCNPGCGNRVNGLKGLRIWAYVYSQAANQQ